MNERQKELFIQAAIMGWTCGLEHPYEWLANIEYHAMNIFVYTELNERVREFQEAFLAFERECQEPLPEGVEPMTMAQFTRLRAIRALKSMPVAETETEEEGESNETL